MSHGFEVDRIVVPAARDDKEALVYIVAVSSSVP
jgi:hypothetical protein